LERIGRANYYTIYRSTLVNNGGGASNVLGTIVLNNTNTATSYTDTTPTDGSIYSYFVTANSAGGTSDKLNRRRRPWPCPRRCGRTRDTDRTYSLANSTSC